jgi:hypothetical protein
MAGSKYQATKIRARGAIYAGFFGSFQEFLYVFLATDSMQTISPVRNWIVIDPAHLRVFIKSERATNNSLGTGI